MGSYYLPIETYSLFLGVFKAIYQAHFRLRLPLIHPPSCLTDIDTMTTPAPLWKRVGKWEKWKIQRLFPGNMAYTRHVLAPTSAAGSTEESQIILVGKYESTEKWRCFLSASSVHVVQEHWMMNWHQFAMELAADQLSRSPSSAIGPKVSDR